MRLDEWQKYIEAQFLDDEISPESEPSGQAPRPETSTENPQSGLVSRPVDGTETPGEPALEAPGPPTPPSMTPEADLQSADQVAMDTRTPQSAEADHVPTPPPPVLPIRVISAVSVPESAEFSPTNVVRAKAFPAEAPEEKSHPPVPKLRKSLQIYPVLIDPAAASPLPAPVEEPISTVSPPPSASVGFGRPPDLDTDIPDFNRFLPSSHPAAAHDADQTLMTPGTAWSDSDESETAPEIEQGAAHPEDAPTVDSQPEPVRETDHASPPPSRVSTVEAPIEEYGVLQDLVSRTARPRRSSRTRAKHARNVPPARIDSSLSASDLWASVPRHVQTLLALGRMEDETEIAQHSYKRPFQEKRHELIERLLDPILSLEDAARLLNVCPTTVRRYTNKGILTYYRKEPIRTANGEAAPSTEKETRQRRFRLSDILAFLEAQQTAIEIDRETERHSQVRRRTLKRSADTITDASTLDQQEA